MAEKSVDRLAVLDEGMTLPITITPQEMHHRNASLLYRRGGAYVQYAPHKIKSLQQSTNNNIEQQTLDHASDTIQPFITNIEQEYAKAILQLI
jgi:hypothetical protein